MMENERSKKITVLWIVILIQGLAISFTAGSLIEHFLFRPIIPVKEIGREELRILIPRDEKELRSQILFNLAQGSILKQIEGWKMYREPEKPKK
jgi:hypothetical protein